MGLIFVPQKQLNFTDFEQFDFYRYKYEAGNINGWSPLPGNVFELRNDIHGHDNNFVELNDPSYYHYNDARGFEQTFATEAGRWHTLTFDYRGRYGYDEDINKILVKIDDSVYRFDDWAVYGSSWKKGEITFTGDIDGLSEITFIEDSRIDDYYGRGMLIDNIKLVRNSYEYYSPAPVVVPLLL